MANLRFIIRNVIDNAILSASPAQVSTSLDEQNLKRQTERGRVCRSSGLASQVIIAAFNAATISAIAFTRHNWSTSSTLASVVSNGGGTLHSTGALSAFSTTGLATGIDVYTERDFEHLKSTVQYFADQAAATQIACTIADAANADGFIQQTRMFAGDFFEVTYNPPNGDVTLTQMDGGIAGRADDGTHIVDKSFKARALRIDLTYVDAADLPTLLAMARYMGRDKEGFVDLYPESTDYAKGLYHRMAFRLVDSPTFNPHQVGLHKNTLLLEET